VLAELQPVEEWLFEDHVGMEAFEIPRPCRGAAVGVTMSPSSSSDYAAFSPLVDGWSRPESDMSSGQDVDAYLTALSGPIVDYAFDEPEASEDAVESVVAEMNCTESVSEGRRSLSPSAAGAAAPRIVVESVGVQAAPVEPAYTGPLPLPIHVDLATLVSAVVEATAWSPETVARLIMERPEQPLQMDSSLALVETVAAAIAQTVEYVRIRIGAQAVASLIADPSGHRVAYDCGLLLAQWARRPPSGPPDAS
jgi:hypothetical protein